MPKLKKQSYKLASGTIYQKQEGGVFFYRYQVNGARKAVSLKTKDIDEAKAKAQRLLPIVQETNAEVLAAHVKVARRLATPAVRLFLSNAWGKYSQHPDRATPATISEQRAYETTFKEFCTCIDQPNIMLHEVTHQHAETYSSFLKTQGLAVDTHNRKIKRLRKIFKVLQDYCQGNQPFASPTLLRRPREEQDLGVRRRSFTSEQVQALLQELDNPSRKLLNKREIRLIYLLGIYTGQRLKDCVLIRWHMVDLIHQKIEIKQYKTGKKVTFPIAAPLLAGLNEALSWKTDDTSYVCPKVAERYNQTDERGKNTGNGLVNIDVLRVIKWIGLEPSVKVPGRKKSITVYGFHSLRHSFVSHCAEAGIPKSVVQSFTGTDAEILDQYYTHVGLEQQAKALKAVAGGIGTMTAQDRLQKAIAFIDALDEQSQVTQQIRAILAD